MPAITSLTPTTLRQLGERFGIEYPGLGARTQQPLALGSVSDVPLPPALHMTLSDLDVRRGYVSRSTQSVPWFVCVVLEGHIRVQQAPTPLTLGPGQALCAHFTAKAPLVVEQPAQARLRTLNVAVLATAPYALPDPTGPHLGTWDVPTTLFDQLTPLACQPLGDWRRALRWQGLLLQLLASGLPEAASSPTAPLADLPQRDRERLAKLHERLRTDPMADYSLAALAVEVAMSPSSLRQKFRALYGYSIFDYLRHCRLQLAYAALTQGMSVQQAAHACGYRHASNFTTAFRRTFGVSPQQVRRVVRH